MVTKAKPQIGLEDKIVTNPELLALLEDRQERKTQAKEYRAVDKKAKEAINALNEVPPYRIGRFLISRETVKAKTVAFETNEGSRVSIKTVDED